MISNEERKSLQIKKLLSLTAKKKCLYVLIETEESKNNYRQNKDENNNIPSPIFFTSTLGDPNGVKEGEVYKICNEHLLDSIIKTEKYTQLIFFDRGYLLEKEKPKFPKINLIVDRDEKNDIYIYTLKNKNNSYSLNSLSNMNNSSNISFICEDLNCKGEGILDIDKNIFFVNHEHEIKHKDYHINEDSHFTVQFFWNCLFKYREIKTLEVILLPNEFDLKMIYNNPSLINQDLYIEQNKNINIYNNQPVNKPKENILFSTTRDIFFLKNKEQENKKEKNTNNFNVSTISNSIEEVKNDKKFIKTKKNYNSNNLNISKITFTLDKGIKKDNIPLFNSINYNTNANNDNNNTNNIIDNIYNCNNNKDNNSLKKDDINNDNNNSNNISNTCINKDNINSINIDNNYIISNIIIDDIDQYKCPPLELTQPSNNFININIKNDNNEINNNISNEKDNSNDNNNNINNLKENLGNPIKQNVENNLICNECEVLNKSNIQNLKDENNVELISNNIKVDEKEEDEIYEGDIFSISGSEEIFKDCYANSKKRRKIITNTNFMIYKNKIYEENELKELSLNEDSFSFCSQCTICVQNKQNLNNSYQNNKNSINYNYNNNNNYDTYNQSINNNTFESAMIPIPKSNSSINDSSSNIQNDLLQRKKNASGTNSGYRYKKKEYQFYQSVKNPYLFFAKIYIESHKENRSSDKRKDLWLKYFENKYGKNHKLGMHFHRDEKTGRIHGYQNRHLEVGYYDKRLVYYCLNKCPGNGRFDCEKELFFTDKPHICNNPLSTQQTEIVKFFTENPKAKDIQIIRVLNE